MAFIEPNNVLYGIAELPARLYGGLVYSNERINHQASTSNSNFIPLQNTSLFRRRELLFPRSATVPIPITRIPAANYGIEINRIKRIEADYYLRPEYHSLEQNRNLLAGEAIVSFKILLFYWRNFSLKRRYAYGLSMTIRRGSDCKSLYFNSTFRLTRTCQFV
jgi:hypothetical protein